jgi:acylglycerol lipase
MDHIEGSFKGARNTKIYYQAWLPEAQVKAVLLVVHGLSEHSGRYMEVVDHFVPLGYAVYAFDHIGHGQSQGIREFVERFTDYTDTLAAYCKLVEGWQAGKAIFLFGHSLGGLIASYYLLDHQASFKGAVISGPGIKLSVSPVTVSIYKILALLAPKMGFWTVDATGISRDSKVVESYLNDPLVFHGQTPLRSVVEILKAQQRVTAEVQEIRLPFIVLQGSADKIVDPGGAQILYHGASSADKTISIYAGLYHEVFHEPERARVLKDVETWLAAHA